LLRGFCHLSGMGSWNDRTKALLLLHFTVLIWGFTGVLGKLIALDAAELVWCRTLIGISGLLLAGRVLKFSLAWPTKWIAEYFLTGVIIAVHWVTFFAAIKASSISITLACLASTTAFVAIIEPIFYKRKIRPYELLIGLIIFAALGLIYKIESEYALGIALATISAFGAALFTVLNGKQIERDDAKRIATYELIGAWLSITVYLLLTERLAPMDWHITKADLGWLLVLGLVCTSFAFVVGVAVMKQLSPFTVALTINLEPVYGIILALIFFQESEHLHAGTYAAGAIILGCLMYNGWRQKRLDSGQALRREMTRN